MQLDDLADGMAKVMFAEIARACSPLLQRIASLESQVKAIPAGPKGDDGKDATPEVVRSTVGEVLTGMGFSPDEILKRIDDLEADHVPKAELVGWMAHKGLSDEDSKRLDELAAAHEGLREEQRKASEAATVLMQEEIEEALAVKPSDIVKAILSLPEIIDEAVQKHLTDNPPPSGKDGVNGKDADEASIRAEIPDIVQRALEALPKPQDGRDGRDGLPGRDGVDGEKGLDGVNGKDGRDALDLDDFEVRGTDNPRVYILALKRGEAVIERELRIPGVIDRGVFKEGSDYAHGDGLTWGGSWWIAQKDHPQGKPGESNDFRLAVKKGRDGRDGAPGKDYVPVVVKVS